ncbi:MAG: indolepyruvate oxidoreductase subunit beta [Thermodesulfobacteriota bacterium]
MHNNQVTNILIVGVGGQGIILASDILAEVFLEAGFDVKKSEVHGMAQRGGSVSTHVRFGSHVYSPLIREGEADIYIAFEELEALRYLHFLAPQPAILLNNERLNPPSVSSGKDKYPAEVGEILSYKARIFKSIPGRELASKAGDQRALNTVLLGALANFLPIPAEIWETCIRRHLPAKAQEINLRAFQFGRSA